MALWTIIFFLIFKNFTFSNLSLGKSNRKSLIPSLLFHKFFSHMMKYRTLKMKFYLKLISCNVMGFLWILTIFLILSFMFMVLFISLHFIVNRNFSYTICWSLFPLLQYLQESPHLLPCQNPHALCFSLKNKQTYK